MSLRLLNILRYAINVGCFAAAIYLVTFIFLVYGEDLALKTCANAEPMEFFRSLISFFLRTRNYLMGNFHWKTNGNSCAASSSLIFTSVRN